MTQSKLKLIKPIAYFKTGVKTILQFLIILTNFFYHPMTKTLHLPMSKATFHFTRLQQNEAYFAMRKPYNSPLLELDILPVLQ